jgi:predicted dehydrogenase
MKKINVALSSFGMSGKVFHAPFLSRHPGFHLSKIVERSRNEVKFIYPEVESVRSFNDLLKDGSVELIVVNVPDEMHYEFVSEALKAGKHVIVEKPFVHKIEEGEKLIELARKKNLILTVFQNRRWDGDFLTVKKLIKSEKLGRLVEFESNYMRYRNYVQPNTWKETVPFGKGIIYNLGSHMIDQALSVFGMPKSVWADIDTLRDEGIIDDYYHIHFSYPRLKVTLKASYLAREETPRYTLHGTQGSFLKYGIDPQEELLKTGCNPYLPDWGKEPESQWGLLNTDIEGIHFKGKVETEAGNYAAFYDNVCEAIRRQAPLAVLPEESLAVIGIIQKCMESNEK